jgi:hypothetical protein
MMLAILQALRANHIAAVQMIDTLLASVKEAVAPSTDPALCQHPSEARTPIPSMGNPRRFRCQTCGAVVDPTHEEGS